MFITTLQCTYPNVQALDNIIWNRHEIISISFSWITINWYLPNMNLIHQYYIQMISSMFKSPSVFIKWNWLFNKRRKVLFSEIVQVHINNKTKNRKHAMYQNQQHIFSIPTRRSYINRTQAILKYTGQAYSLQIWLPALKDHCYSNISVTNWNSNA